MAKYSKAAKKRVSAAVKRMEKGTLKSGKSGKTVKDRTQAIAIGLSEARKKGAKVPSKKTATKKAATKKSAPKKSASKAASKKAATKRVKKVASKKTTTNKSAPKKLAPKKTAGKSSKQAGAAKPAAKKRASPKHASAASQQPKDENNTTTQVNLGAMPDEPVVGSPGMDSDTAPVEEKSPLVVKPEDPLLVQDKKVMAKAAAKSDPRHHFQVSSVKKGAVKPSGKKPLWNR